MISPRRHVGNLLPLMTLGRRRIRSTPAQRRANSMRRGVRARAGFSLVEVIVALGLLTVVLLGLALFVSNMAHNTSDSRLLGTASELAANRLETIKSATDYASIDTFAVKETSIPGSSTYMKALAFRCLSFCNWTFMRRAMNSSINGRTVSL